MVCAFRLSCVNVICSAVVTADVTRDFVNYGERFLCLMMYKKQAIRLSFTKGYIFKTDEVYRIIIGSSNITSAALTRNQEWNTKLEQIKHMKRNI